MSASSLMGAEKVLSALYSSKSDSSSDEECSPNCEEYFAVSETMNRAGIHQQ